MANTYYVKYTRGGVPVKIKLIDNLDGTYSEQSAGGGGGGGGGGAVTVVDGGDVTQGADADVKVTGDNAGTVSAKLRGLSYLWALVIDVVNGRVKTDGSTVTQPVSGTFWQATQPVSQAAQPLPTGGSTSALQTTANTSLSNIDSHTPALGAAATAGSTPVNIANDQTVPVKGASGALTDNSGSIVTGGTAVAAAPTNASRKYIFIQNNSNADLWFKFGATAVQSQPSAKIQAGAQYENPAHFCPTDALSIIGATAGQTFTVWQA